ncbi:hypothetical protein Tco_1349751, partial [Tanacetum coccineum]
MDIYVASQIDYKRWEEIEKWQSPILMNDKLPELYEGRFTQSPRRGTPIMFKWLILADVNIDSLVNKDASSNNETGSDGKSNEQPMLHNFETKTEASAETSFETTFIQSFLDTLTKHNLSISTSNRPLLLLLVTNITIVVAPLLLEKVKQIERKGSSSCNAGFGDNI